MRRTLERRALSVVVLLIAITIVPLLVTSSLRIVMQPWIVHAEYAIGRVPDDPLGLAGTARSEMALLGLESIEPGSRGMAILREARLPDGQLAFTEKEIVHMQDVRDLVGVMLGFQLWASIGLGVLVLALAALARTRPAVPRALRLGVVLSIVTAAVVGLIMAVAWDGFFTRFHEIFFEGTSWKFRDSTTLRRVYPDEFWMGVGAWLAVITVLLALALWFGAGYWQRRMARRRETAPGPIASVG